MSATRAWNNSTPLGSQAASTMDNAVRDLKVDIDERMELDHLWGVSQATDGYHYGVTLLAPNDRTPFTTASPGVANTLTGATVGGLFNLAQTWNTSGICSAFRLAITDTASNTASSLIDILVGGVSKFKVNKAGIISSYTGTPSNLTFLRGDGAWATPLGVPDYTKTFGVIYNLTADCIVTITTDSSSIANGTTETTSVWAGNSLGNDSCSMIVRKGHDWTVIASSGTGITVVVNPFGA